MAVQLTSEMIKGAQENQEKYGIPASITLGQIILESSGAYAGGLSKLAYKANNLFGMKGAGNAGVYHINTTEEGKNGTYTVTTGFRKYKSVSDSIDDHGLLLSKTRYTSKTSNASNVEEYAEALQAAGYATDSQYAKKLISVINSNNLKQYDSGTIGSGTETVPETSNNDTQKLDIFGQVVRFILIAGLLILAVVFLLQGLGVSSIKKVI